MEYEETLMGYDYWDQIKRDIEKELNFKFPPAGWIHGLLPANISAAD